MIEEVSNACEKAKKEPYHVQEFFVNGFKLMIHWHEGRQWFECVLHYSPYSSSYYHYSNTVEHLIEMIWNTMSSWNYKGNYNLKK